MHGITKEVCVLKRIFNICTPLDLTLSAVSGEPLLELRDPGEDGARRGGGCCNPLEVGVHCLGTYMGSVYLSSYFFKPTFVIMDKEHIPIMKLHGPSQFMLFICCAGQSLYFEITELENNSSVGTVTRRGKACCPPLLGAAEPTVEVDVKTNLEATKKILALAAGFFIEHLYTHEHYGMIS